MVKSILIVGGTGYLGRHLSPVLIQKGYEVAFTGSQKVEKKDYYRVDFDDITSFSSLKGKKFDLVIVLAAKLSSLGTSKLDHPDLFTNCLGYAAFLEFVKENRIASKLVFTSSMTVYSPGAKSPVSEDSRIAPVNTYALGKYFGERITEFFGLQNEILVAVLRLPGIYGGDKTGGLIYNTIKNYAAGMRPNISTGSLVYWETIHVDDLCEMILLFLSSYSWDKPNEVFNVSYGVETDFYQTVEFIRTEMGITEQINFSEIKGYTPFFLSNAKLSQLIPVKRDYYSKLKAYIAATR